MIQNKLKIIVGIPGLIIISILVLSAYSICSVVRDAKRLAKDTPYCIQISGGDRTDYRPAKTLLDLSIQRMQGNKYSQHHAILVLGQKPSMLYHWSYWNSQFKLDTFNHRSGNLPGIYCHPKRYFVNNLPFLFPKINKNKNLYVRFSQQEFSIPKAYHPRANGGQNPNFSIFLSPNFESLGRTAKIYEQIYIQVGKKQVSFIKKFMESISQGKQLKELTVENQCIKPMIRNGKVDSEWMYYTVNDANEFTTLIGCYSKSCQHRFIYNDMHILFYHSPQRLPQWKQMQNDLKNLLDSFAIESNK
ncbi:hypothetical protein [Plectonema radiosum]|uniref:hypothetical protein n=1 Tax=Plectonema radiosum TaxID=945768 RepID=UPI001D15B13F|nr:hypothetical protein [Plectonema radiosum]